MNLVTNRVYKTSFRSEALQNPILQFGSSTYKLTSSDDFIPSPKQKIIYRLYSYGMYNKNWDGYNGEIPSFDIIENAVKFLVALPNNLKLPTPGLSNDGQIDLFWEQENIFINVGFTSDGLYSYYARDIKGKEFFGDNILFSNFPDELIVILNQLKK